MGRMTPYMKWKNSHGPNHQPEIISLYKSHESTIFDNASPVPADFPWPFLAPFLAICLVTRLYIQVYPHSITMKSSLFHGHDSHLKNRWEWEYPCFPNATIDRFPNVFLVPSGYDLHNY